MATTPGSDLVSRSPKTPPPTFSNTSNTAALRWPESSAASRSGSTTCAPRLTLMIAAPRGSQPKKGASMMPLRVGHRTGGT